MAAAVLHLTDCHLLGDPSARLGEVDTGATLDQVIDHLRRQGAAPDCVLATGDLSQDGSPESYARLAEKLASLGAPVHCLAGNHDDRAVLTSVLGAAGFGIEGAVDCGAWRVVLLNTAGADPLSGRLEAGELQRLEAELLDHKARPILACIHHNPVPVGGPWQDMVGIENPDDLFALAGAHSNLRAVVFGHVHTAFDETRGRLRLIASPATSFGVTTDADGLLCAGPAEPGYRRLSLLADGTLETQAYLLADGARAPVSSTRPPTAR